MNNTLAKTAHSIRVKADSMRLADVGEGLVVEQYLNGEVVRRATVDLGSWGAEEVAQLLGVLLKRRRERAGRLATALEHAGVP